MLLKPILKLILVEPIYNKYTGHMTSCLSYRGFYEQKVFDIVPNHQSAFFQTAKIATGQER